MPPGESPEEVKQKIIDNLSPDAQKVWGRDGDLVLKKIKDGSLPNEKNATIAFLRSQPKDDDFEEGVDTNAIFTQIAEAAQEIHKIEEAPPEAPPELMRRLERLTAKDLFKDPHVAFDLFRGNSMGSILEHFLEEDEIDANLPGLSAEEKIALQNMLVRRRTSRQTGDKNPLAEVEKNLQEDFERAKTEAIQSIKQLDFKTEKISETNFPKIFSEKMLSALGITHVTPELENLAQQYFSKDIQETQQLIAEKSETGLKEMEQALRDKIKKEMPYLEHEKLSISQYLNEQLSRADTRQEKRKIIRDLNERMPDLRKQYEVFSQHYRAFNALPMEAKKAYASRAKELTARWRAKWSRGEWDATEEMQGMQNLAERAKSEYEKKLDTNASKKNLEAAIKKATVEAKKPENLRNIRSEHDWKVFLELRGISYEKWKEKIKPEAQKDWNEQDFNQRITESYEALDNFRWDTAKKEITKGMKDGIKAANSNPKGIRSTKDFREFLKKHFDYLEVARKFGLSDAQIDSMMQTKIIPPFKKAWLKISEYNAKNYLENNLKKYISSAAKKEFSNPEEYQEYLKEQIGSLKDDFGITGVARLRLRDKVILPAVKKGWKEYAKKHKKRLEKGQKKGKEKEAITPEQKKENQKFTRIAKKIADKDIAAAMIKSFENANTKERKRYLNPDSSEGIQNKVKQYNEALKKIGETQKAVHDESEKNLKYHAEYHRITEKYERSKKTYDKKFISPRAYAAELLKLQNTMQTTTGTEKIIGTETGKYAIDWNLVGVESKETIHKTETRFGQLIRQNPIIGKLSAGSNKILFQTEFMGILAHIKGRFLENTMTALKGAKTEAEVLKFFIENGHYAEKKGYFTPERKRQHDRFHEWAERKIGKKELEEARNISPWAAAKAPEKTENDLNSWLEKSCQQMRKKNPAFFSLYQKNPTAVQAEFFEHFTAMDEAKRTSELTRLQGIQDPKSVLQFFSEHEEGHSHTSIKGFEDLSPSATMPEVENSYEIDWEIIGASPEQQKSAYTAVEAIRKNSLFQELLNQTGDIKKLIRSEMLGTLAFLKGQKRTEIITSLKNAKTTAEILRFFRDDSAYTRKYFSAERVKQNQRFNEWIYKTQSPEELEAAPIISPWATVKVSEKPEEIETENAVDQALLQGFENAKTAEENAETADSAEITPLEISEDNAEEFSEEISDIAQKVIDKAAMTSREASNTESEKETTEESKTAKKKISSDELPQIMETLEQENPVFATLLAKDPASVRKEFLAHFSAIDETKRPTAMERLKSIPTEEALEKFFQEHEPGEEHEAVESFESIMREEKPTDSSKKSEKHAESTNQQMEDEDLPRIDEDESEVLKTNGSTREEEIEAEILPTGKTAKTVENEKGKISPEPQKTGELKGGVEEEVKEKVWQQNAAETPQKERETRETKKKEKEEVEIHRIKQLQRKWEEARKKSAENTKNLINAELAEREEVMEEEIQEQEICRLLDLLQSSNGKNKVKEIFDAIADKSEMLWLLRKNLSHFYLMNEDAIHFFVEKFGEYDQAHDASIQEILEQFVRYVSFLQGEKVPASYEFLKLENASQNIQQHQKLFNRLTQLYHRLERVDRVEFVELGSSKLAVDFTKSGDKKRFVVFWE